MVARENPAVILWTACAKTAIVSLVAAWGANLLVMLIGSTGEGSLLFFVGIAFGATYILLAISLFGCVVSALLALYLLVRFGMGAILSRRRLLVLWLASIVLVSLSLKLWFRTPPRQREASIGTEVADKCERQNLRDAAIVPISPSGDQGVHPSKSE